MSSSEKKSASSKLWLIIIILVILLAIIILLIYRSQTTLNPVSTESQIETQYLEDDSFWQPDAIIESNDQILEMKFGF